MKQRRHHSITRRQREILNLRDSEGKSWQQIARHFNVTDTSIVRRPYDAAKRELAWRESERKRIAAHLPESSRSIYHKRAVKDQHRLARIESMDEGAPPLPVRVPRPGDFGSPEREARIAANREQKARELAERFEAPEDPEQQEADEAAEQARLEATRIAALPVVYRDGCNRYWTATGIGVDEGDVFEMDGRWYHDNNEVRIVTGTPPPLPSQQKQQKPKVERPDPVAESLVRPTIVPDARYAPFASPGMGEFTERPDPARQPVQPRMNPQIHKPVMVEPGISRPAEPTLLELPDLTPPTTGTQVVFDDDGWLLNFAGQPVAWKWRDGQRINEITGALLEVRPMPAPKPREPQARIG